MNVAGLWRRVIVVGECWLWPGAVNHGAPEVRIDGRLFGVRGLLREALGLPPGRRGGRSGRFGPAPLVRCGQSRCLNPAHWWLDA